MEELLKKIDIFVKRAKEVIREVDIINEDIFINQFKQEIKGFGLSPEEVLRRLKRMIDIDGRYVLILQATYASSQIWKLYPIEFYRDVFSPTCIEDAGLKNPTSFSYLKCFRPSWVGQCLKGTGHSIDINNGMFYRFILPKLQDQEPTFQSYLRQKFIQESQSGGFSDPSTWKAPILSPQDEKDLANELDKHHERIEDNFKRDEIESIMQDPKNALFNRIDHFLSLSNKKHSQIDIIIKGEIPIPHDILIKHIIPQIKHLIDLSGAYEVEFERSQWSETLYHDYFFYFNIIPLEFYEPISDAQFLEQRGLIPSNFATKPFRPELKTITDIYYKNSVSFSLALPREVWRTFLPSQKSPINYFVLEFSDPNKLIEKALRAESIAFGFGDPNLYEDNLRKKKPEEIRSDKKMVQLDNELNNERNFAPFNQIENRDKSLHELAVSPSIALFYQIDHFVSLAEEVHKEVDIDDYWISQEPPLLAQEILKNLKNLIDIDGSYSAKLAGQGPGAIYYRIYPHEFYHDVFNPTCIERLGLANNLENWRDCLKKSWVGDILADKESNYSSHKITLNDPPINIYFEMGSFYLQDKAFQTYLFEKFKQEVISGGFSNPETWTTPGLLHKDQEELDEDENKKFERLETNKKLDIMEDPKNAFFNQINLFLKLAENEGPYFIIPPNDGPLSQDDESSIKRHYGAMFPLGTFQIDSIGPLKGNELKSRLWAYSLTPIEFHQNIFQPNLIERMALLGDKKDFLKAVIAGLIDTFGYFNGTYQTTFYKLWNYSSRIFNSLISEDFLYQEFRKEALMYGFGDPDTWTPNHHPDNIKMLDEDQSKKNKRWERPLAQYPNLDKSLDQLKEEKLI